MVRAVHSANKWLWCVHLQVNVKTRQRWLGVESVCARVWVGGWLCGYFGWRKAEHGSTTPFEEVFAPKPRTTWKRKDELDKLEPVRCAHARLGHFCFQALLQSLFLLRLSIVSLYNLYSGQTMYSLYDDTKELSYTLSVCVQLCEGVVTKGK